MALTYSNAVNAWLKGETESPDRFSRETVTVLSGESVVHGEVVAKVTKVCPTTGTADSGNTGDGTCGTVTASAQAKVGVYTLTCTAESANAGTFTVESPDGDTLPDATVAVAFTSDQLNFTIADGAEDFDIGDIFTIEITAGSGKVVPVDFSGVDGSQDAIGLMYADTDASLADVDGVIITRDAIIQSEHITWPAAESDTNIVIGLAALAARGIINRSEV